MFKNSFNLKGYGFDVYGSTDLAILTLILQMVIMLKQLQMHKTLLILKCFS
jgi:hypothetical protein